MFTVEPIRQRLLASPLGGFLAGSSVAAAFGRGAAIVFIIGIAERFVRFPVNVTLARAMGVEEFGYYTYVASWLALAGLVATVGIPTSLLRFIPEYVAREDWGRLRGVIRRANHIVAVAAVVSALLVLAFVLWRRDAMEDRLFATFVVAALLMPIGALSSIRHSSLLALRQVTWAEGRKIFEPLLLLAFVAVAYFGLDSRIGAPEVIAFGALVALISLVVSDIVVRRTMPAAARAAEPVYATLSWVRVSLPLFLVAGMRTLLNRIDVLLIGILLGTTPAGLYVVAANLSQFTSFGLTAANTIAQPMVAEFHARGDKEQLQRVVSLTVWSSTLSSIVLAVPLVIAHRFLLGLFGAEFQDAASVTLILVGVMVLDATTGPIGALLNMTGHQDRNAFILGASGVVNAVLNVPAILLWGVNGAAIATGVSITAKNLWTWFEVKHRLGINSSVFGTRPQWRS